MNATHRTKLLAALIAGSALAVAGCNRTPPSEPSASNATTPPALTSHTPSATEQPGNSVVAKVDDATITTKVKAAVMAEPGIRSLKIDVDTKDGIVTLNGSVDSQAHHDRAVQIAQNVNGVKQVVDNLAVSATS